MNRGRWTATSALAVLWISVLALAGAGAGTAQAAGSATTKCSSRYTFRIPGGARLGRVTVSGRRVRPAVRGRQVVVGLGGRTGRVVVRFAYRLRSGRTVRGAKALHVCAPRQRAAVRPKPEPCDIYASGGTPCVAAFSSTRALFSAYAGPLYEVQRSSDSRTLNVGVLTRGGYADAGPQNAFCARTSCVVAKIYDQTADHDNLIPQAPTSAVYSNTGYAHDPVSATALPIVAGGHRVYGLKFQSGSPTGLPCPTAATCAGNHGEAYNNGRVRAKGVAVGARPESIYGVFGGTYSGSDCCFDFGNSEITGADDGNGTMDALNLSRDCWDACGPAGGPWVEADLENGMFMTGTPTSTPQALTAFIGGSYESGDGWCCAATARNAALPYPFVTGILDNPGSRTFAIRGGNANSGGLTTYYDGSTPPGTGYSPMRKQGAIILGSGGDQGTTDGEFFEGVMTAGVSSSAREAAVQANIVGVGYRLVPGTSAP